MTGFASLLASCGTDAGPPWLVLDGGLATELEARGHDISGSLWSARVLRDDPDEIAAVHAAYLDAGADVIISASYQVSREGLCEVGGSADEADALLRASVQIARRARDRMGHGVVAASVGPYGAILHDGSEYRGNYDIAPRALMDFHRRRLDVLIDAAPDALAIETIPDVGEAEALAAALDGCEIPAWMSFTGPAAMTWAGQSMGEAAAIAAAVPCVVAVGVNCVAPGGVSAALARMSDAGLPMSAYPNSGAVWDAQARTWNHRDVDGGFAEERVSEWVTAGARLIGGCCGVGPDQIGRLARMARGSTR